MNFATSTHTPHNSPVLCPKPGSFLCAMRSGQDTQVHPAYAATLCYTENETYINKVGEIRMAKKTIYFISSNEHKIKEVTSILNGLLEDRGVTVEAYSLKVDEIQDKDMKKIVIDKARKAYAELCRPLIVEHTGLEIIDFGNLPGGLTQIFWTALGTPEEETADAGETTESQSEDSTKDKKPKVDNNLSCDKFCEYFADKSVRAITWVAYCDGKKVYTTNGQIMGKVVKPRKYCDFQWDPIFLPNGEKETFAEMSTAEKNDISMRRKALNKLYKLYLCEKYQKETNAHD